MCWRWISKIYVAGGGGLLFCRSWPDDGCTWTGTHKLKPIDMWGPELYPAAHLSLNTPRLTLLVSRRGIADFSSLFQAVGGLCHGGKTSKRGDVSLRVLDSHLQRPDSVSHVQRSQTNHYDRAYSCVVQEIEPEVKEQDYYDTVLQFACGARNFSDTDRQF